MLAGGRLPGVLRFPDPHLFDGVITLRSKTPEDVKRRRSPRGGLPDGAYLVHLWSAPSSE